LLVTTSSIPPATRAELLRLKPARIVIAGGTGVVSNTVLSQLDAYTTGPVTREAGIDRFATAADISKKNFTVNVPVVYIANGRTGLVDALAAGPAAAKHGGPTLLVTTSSIPPATRAELLRLKPARIVIAGGTGVVSNTVLSQLAAYIGSPPPPPPPPPANRAPVAADDSASVDEDSTANLIAVLANDTDSDGDVLTVSAVTPPMNGTASIGAGGGSVAYTPAPDFSGGDSFTYTVRDPDGASDTATVHVAVTDLPDNQSPTAAPDVLTIAEGCTWAVRVLGNDSDPEDPNRALRVTGSTNGSLGTVVIVNHMVEGSDVPRAVAYTSTGGTGTDSFTYTVSDSGGATAVGTVAVTVIASTGDSDGDGTPNECDSFVAAATASVNLDFDGEAGGDWQDAGFTGVMTNSRTDPGMLVDADTALSGTSQWLDPSVAEGDAFNGGNDQRNAFQVAFAPPAGTFEVHGVVCDPYPTLEFSSVGIFFGLGDQDNYIKAVVNTKNGAAAVHDARELNGDGFGVSTKPEPAIAGVPCVDLYLTVNKAAGTYSPAYSLDGGTTRLGFGGVSASRTVPAAWLDSSNELAIGIISTSQGPAAEFTATWELLEVGIP
jgi:hypothetical protein